MTMLSRISRNQDGVPWLQDSSCSLGASPILTLVHKPPALPRDPSRMSRSRRGAFTTAMSSGTELQIWTHRRLWLTKRRRSPLLHPWMLRPEGLQDGALGDDKVDAPVLHDYAADAKLTEVVEGGAG